MFREFPLQKQLPIEELVEDINRHLDVKTRAKNCTLVAKTWQNFFDNSNYWKTIVKETFHIDENNLYQLSVDYPVSDFKQVYKALFRLKQKLHLLPVTLKSLCFDPDRQPVLLACCTDNANYMIDVTPEEELKHWVEIALYAECHQIAMTIFKKNTAKSTQYLDKAMTAHNPTLVRSLIEYRMGMNIKPNDKVLNWATSLGNMRLVHFLLETENNFELTPSLKTLHIAVRLGNLKLLQQLLKQYNLKPNCYMGERPRSGNQDLVPYLVEECNVWRNINALKQASASGNWNLVCNLIDKHKLRPDKDCLKKAIQFGHTELAFKFINEIKELEIDDSVLHCAVENSNFELVSYFLNSENEYQFSAQEMQKIGWLAASTGNLEFFCFIQGINKQTVSINKETLMTAFMSGNLELVQYLLDQRHQFNFPIDVCVIFSAFRSPNFEIMRLVLQTNKDSFISSFSDVNHALMRRMTSLPPRNYKALRYLLNPNNELNVYIPVDILDSHFHDKLTKRLISSEICSRKLFNELKQNNFAQVEEHAQSAYSHSPLHFYQVVKYAFEKDKTEIVMDFLSAFIEELAKQAEQLPKIEKKLIEKMMVKYVLPKKELMLLQAARFNPTSVASMQL